MDGVGPEFLRQPIEDLGTHVFETEISRNPFRDLNQVNSECRDDRFTDVIQLQRESQ